MRERKKNRLAGYDYSHSGAYFVTLCVKNRECLFGKIIIGGIDGFVGNGLKPFPTTADMQLNECGKIAGKQWEWLFGQYDYIQKDEFIVMPNHVHGIVKIVGDDHCFVGNGRDRSLRIKSIPQLIGAYKTTSSKIIHQTGYFEFQWQKSYHDRIIRNDEELNRIREYIKENPVNWQTDQENPAI